MNSFSEGLGSPNVIERISYYSETLRLLRGSENNDFNSNVWTFEGEINLTADFNIVRSFVLGSEYDVIDTITVAKCMFLDAVVRKRSVGIYRAQFNQIVKLFAFLSTKNVFALNDELLSEFLFYSLTTYIHDNRVLHKHEILSAHQLKLGLSMSSWFNTLTELNTQPGYVLQSSFSQEKINNALKKAVHKSTDGNLAFGDWLTGGDLNSLTLDYGRFFVEHNFHFYNRYASYSQAIRFCQSRAKVILERAGSTAQALNHQPTINKFLTNTEVENLPISFRKKVSYPLLCRIKKETQKMFIETLSKLKAIEVLELGITEKGLFNNYINRSNQQSDIDFLSRLAELFAQIEFKELYGPLQDTVFDELTIYESNRPDFDFIGFKKKVTSELHRLKDSQDVAILDDDYFKSIGLKISNSLGATYLAEFNRSVEAAGVTVFVASAGWRESEFGFSLKDIKMEKNHDVRDQLAFPCRYFIHGIVPKTHGASKQLREINLAAFRVLLKQKTITESTIEEPVLYSFNRGLTKNPSKSGEFIERSVKKNWEHFVLNYEPFQSIDKFCEQNSDSAISLLDIEKNSKKWRQMKPNLLREFESNLVNAYEIARSEFRRVNFYIEYDKRRGFVKEYIEGSLAAGKLDIMTSYLTESTKKRLRAMKKGDVGPLIVDEVTAEIMGSCRYPTAHALRHMWAEAVLRRFTGNVGDFIRSSFKHISPSMWQAYINDKANSQVLLSAKREVISAVLSRYLSGESDEFAGAMSKYIDRLVGSTGIYTTDRLAEVKELLMDEIVDIQASSWGFCLLKSHALTTAKCAESGEPRRYASEPSVCVHCTNFLAGKHSETSLAVLANTSMKVVKNSEVPAPFQKAALKNLKAVNKQLKKLNADPSLIIAIEEVTC